MTYSIICVTTEIYDAPKEGNSKLKTIPANAPKREVINVLFDAIICHKLHSQECNTFVSFGNSNRFTNLGIHLKELT